MGAAWLLTCEHGGNQVPAPYAGLFTSARATRALASHRGYDAGALALARALRQRLCCPLLSAETSRLLVDLNRPAGHRRLLSEFSSGLAPAERKQLMADIHGRHWQAVRQAVTGGIATTGSIVHIGVHSFTPTLHGVMRKADIGLLYDPSRPAERAFAACWQRALREALPSWNTRRNYPYLGAAAGLTTALRRDYPGARYLGLELEVNQSRLTDAAAIPALAATLATTLDSVLAGMPATPAAGPV